MNKNNSLPLDLWSEIFNAVCRQVERTEINSSADRLNIIVKGRVEPLQATHDELDAAFNKCSGNNVQDVVHSFMKSHKVLDIYKNTLVGFFDIQAYSVFIDETEFKDVIWKTNNLISKIKSWANTNIYGVKFDCWILSDSIILVVDTDRSPLFAGSIEYFLGTCSVIMADAMKQKFPLRGAIGGGDFFKDGELMVSSALVDAARYEKMQNWLGAVLTPSAVNLIEQAKEAEIRIKGKSNIDFLSDSLKSYVRYGKIPWKNGISIINPDKSYYYIKPYQMADQDWAWQFLLPHFKDKEGRVENSHCLYGQD